MTKIIERLGKFGEFHALQFMKRHEDEYENPRLSDDKYDSVGDLYFGDNFSVEVKTKTIIKKYQSFPLEYSQWNKVDNANQVFFISIPSVSDERSKMYRRNHRDSFFALSSFGSKNEPTRMYPIDKLELVKELDKNSSYFLYENTISSYKK